MSIPKPIKTQRAPEAIGPYSQAIADGQLLFCSGQIALDPNTQTMVGDGDVEAEARQVLANLEAVLEAAGTGFERVLFTTIYLMDLADFDAVNAIYGKAVSQAAPPARATVQVAGLPKGARVEISVVAKVR